MLNLESDEKLLEMSQQGNEIVEDEDDQEYAKLVRTYSKVFEVDEKKEFVQSISADLESKKKIKVSSFQSDLLKISDRGVVPLRVIEINGGKIVISQGSIINFKGDAIVNAANEYCLGGGGVDGLISHAGGKALYEAREALPVEIVRVKGVDGKIFFKDVRCPAGEARLTIGGDLKAKYCIHAVGPNYAWHKVEEGNRILRSAYRSVMKVVEKTDGISSVGFCLISAGIFRGNNSRDSVIRQGFDTIMEMITPGQEIHMIAYTAIEVRILLELAPLENVKDKEELLIDIKV